MMVSNPFYFPCVFYEIISEKPSQFNLFYPGGGGTLGSIFARYIPLTSQNSLPHDSGSQL